MSVAVTVDQLAGLAPQCHADYRAAFGGGAAVLARYAIAHTPLRMAHFMAQVLHESGALTLQYENLRYSARRLAAIWPRRFRPAGPLDPRAYANRPAKLANAVYGGRMGNMLPGDGYLYRGRGLLQLTGKDSYERATTILRATAPQAPDFTRVPDAVVSAQWCLQVAAAHWAEHGCNQAADQDDVAHVTLLINGGAIGLAERILWTAKTRAVWGVVSQMRDAARF